MTAKIFLKLILAVLSVLLVALTAVDFLVSRMVESTYIEGMRRELTEKTLMLTTLPRGELDKNFAQLARTSAARLTLIAADGKVLLDSEANPERMENHKNRPELRAALRGETGWSKRPSPTLGMDFLYLAVPVPGGALRMAVPLAEINSQVNAIRKRVLAATALAFLPAILIAAFFARYVSRKLASIIHYAGQLAQGNFHARLERVGKDELGLLGRKLNDTGEKLERMFEELQREQTELEKMERIRKDFVINVSHELRTPLASIQGYTETLLDGAIDDREHNVRFLTIIRQNAERLARLTADLLTLSRIELRTQKFQFAAYYVNALLREDADTMRPMAEKKHITITLEPAPEATEVFCDSEAVHQVLSNLLDNALKYTPEGGEVFIGARAAPAGKHEMVQVYVRDTGAGIPSEELPRLFERFYRVDKARSRELGGTGLGLAIVKHLVRAQGGEVGVTSQPGKGSEFSFTVPVHDLGLIEYGSAAQELTVS